MKFIKKIGKKLGIIPDNKTDEIMDERSKIKMNMTKSLNSIGFSEDEIQEVLSILTKCEQDVQKIKDEMIGTNINNDFAVEITQQKLNEIRKLELETANNIKNKISEIKQRKSL